LSFSSLLPRNENGCSACRISSVSGVARNGVSKPFEGNILVPFPIAYQAYAVRLRV
jgi:hypothetical protein